MAKKRPNGSGTAVKRGGTWTAIWTVATYIEDGKVKQKRKTKGGFRTKTEAQRFADNPTKTDNAACPTLHSYWLIWSKGAMLKLSKAKQTALKIAKRKAEPIMHIPVDKLTIGDMQEIIDKRTPTYYTARDVKTLLSHLYRLALAEERARTNLTEFLTLPDLEEKEMQPFDELELHKMWAAYGNGDSFIGFVLLMVYTGMMPGELFGLKKDMVDWDNYTITGCGLKTKKRKATPIAFPDIIAPVLLDLCERSESKVGNVLCMNRDKFYDEYHAALKRIGVRDLAPYSCRHTTATALALGNIAPSVIQEVMRHTKFSTTQRYIHPDVSAARGAVNTLGKGRAR